MQKKWLVAGVSFILFGILLGAFGAHGLKSMLKDPVKLQSFETGVRYQLLHGIAFLGIIRIIDFVQDNLRSAYWLLMAGIILFSGSIYLLTLSNIFHAGGMSKWLGPITPIGGVLMLLGWTIVLIKIIQTKTN